MIGEKASEVIPWLCHVLAKGPWENDFTIILPRIMSGLEGLHRMHRTLYLVHCSTQCKLASNSGGGVVLSGTVIVITVLAVVVEIETCLWTLM